jgi:NADH-quinone oxidoreductase subunit N
MSAPIVWILLPGAVSVILLVFQRQRFIVYVTGTALAVLLAGLAGFLTIGGSIGIGSISIPFADTLTILGRRFVLDSNDRATLLLIYLGLAFWLIGSWAAHSSRIFVPLSLAVAGLLTAALAVEPFLYAAIILQMVVLVSIPFISTPGTPTNPGVVRYLTYQTLGFPFILFTGWLISGVDSGVTNSEQLILAYVLLGLGFWLLLSIFPFHTWIPMIAEESHPYAVAFLLYELPLAVSLFGLGFLARYPWLRETAGLYTILEIAGVTMIFIAGVFAAFQDHLGRMMGYAILVEIGISLIAIRLGMQPGENERLLGLFFAILLPRALSLGVWALALVAFIRHLGKSDGGSITSRHMAFRNVKGYARQLPIAAFSLILAHFSLAGFPLLVGFPVRLAIWEGTAKISLYLASGVLIGYIGLMVAGIRSMAVLVISSEDIPWKLNETKVESILLIVGSITLLIMGLFPQLFTPALAQMADIFLRSSP